MKRPRKKPPKKPSAKSMAESPANRAITISPAVKGDKKMNRRRPS